MAKQRKKKEKLSAAEIEFKEQTDVIKRRIIKKCKEAGTYNVAYMITIDILAETLAIRKDAYKRWLKDGGETVAEHTPDRGTKANLVKHPALVIVRDFSTLATTYLKELGLTAKEADKLTGFAINEKPADPFMKDLEELDVL